MNVSDVFAETLQLHLEQLIRERCPYKEVCTFAGVTVVAMVEPANKQTLDVSMGVMCRPPCGFTEEAFRDVQPEAARLTISELGLEDKVYLE